MPAGFFRAGDDGQFLFCPTGSMVAVNVFPMPRLVMMGYAFDMQWQVLMTAAAPSVLLFIPYSPA